jgi:putative FmdB family regulatory protein
VPIGTTGVMPIYEYRCDHCGKHFDVLQKFSDETLTVHAECGGGPVERLISPPAFHFKGSGWYVTDYAKTNGSSSPAKTENSGESKSESTSDTNKSESSTKKSESASPAPAASESKSKSESK